MNITFSKVIPTPLIDSDLSINSIWNTDFSFKTSNKILLNAVSGKGKSTFINILCGVRKDFEGDIKFDNISISKFHLDDWSELRKSKISVVFQDLQLFDDLTVWENLLIKNELTNHLLESELNEMLTSLNIENLKHKKCGNLSLGQQQRVAIIRSLAQPFEILLMDEPFSHLDKTNQTKALMLIDNELKKNNAGLIITTLGETPGIEFDDIFYI